MDNKEAAKDMEFRLSADGAKLQAIVSPVDTRQALDSNLLKRLLAAQGYGQLFLLENAIKDLLKRYENPSAAFTLDIGERRDGRVAVTLSDDKLTAYLTITPACGGRATDRQQALDALAAAGVKYGLDETEINTAVALGQAEARPVARGKAPVHGKDTEFESLIPEIKGRQPKVNEHGIADYRDLGLFISVKEGAPLMRRTPPTRGESGMNVLGATMPGKDGKDTPFAPGLSGAAIDPGDPNLLVAAISGQPIRVLNGATVEPTLSVQNIDLSTGNLNFEGTVNIAADVKPGMKVRVSGDVIIGGMVEAADIEAGGDITIKGGVIGHGESRSHEERIHPNATRIHSGGSVYARFIENALVEAGNCIVVEEVVKQSNLTAINQVVVGKEGSKKGHLIGGLTRATMLVQVAVAGSPADVETQIEVGVNPLIHAKLDNATQKLQKLERENEEIVRILAFAAENPQRINPELLLKVNRTAEKLQLDLAECRQENETLEKQMSLADDAKVVIGQRVYSHTQVRIGNKLRQQEEERGSGIFRLGEEGEVLFVSA